MIAAARFRIFVYGTLLPGSPNYKELCEGRVKAALQALVQGQLYHLPPGYPALVKGQGWVRGEVICFDDASLLRDIDAFEDFRRDRPLAENLYLRENISVYDINKRPLGQAQTYRMSLYNIRQLNGTPVSGGDWKPRGQN